MKIDMNAFSATPHGVKHHTMNIWFFMFFVSSSLASLLFHRRNEQFNSCQMRFCISHWASQIASECRVDEQQPNRILCIHIKVSWTYDNAYGQYPTPATALVWNFASSVAHYLGDEFCNWISFATTETPKSECVVVVAVACHTLKWMRDLSETKRRKHSERFAHKIWIKSLINVKLSPFSGWAERTIPLIRCARGMP